MQAVDLILFLSAILLFIILIADLVKDFIKHRHSKAHHKSNLFKYFTIIVSIVVFGQMIVSVFATDPELSYPNERITFGDTHQIYEISNSGYAELVKQSPNDIDLNFKYVESLKLAAYYPQDKYQSIGQFRKSIYNQVLIEHFNQLIINGTDDAKDMGYLFLALNELNLEGDLNVVKLDLAEIENKSLKYYDYVNGLNLIKQNEYDKQAEIELLLLRSIKKHESLKLATKLLSSLYFYEQSDLSKVNVLLTNESTVDFVPDNIKRVTYLSSGEFGNYFGHLFNVRIANAYWLGVLFAYLISITWIWYLRQIDIFEPEKWRHIILVFILSCLTIFLVFPYNDFVTYFLGYVGGGDSVSEFVREFVKIGLIEETVKIIPVLIILKFSKAINEPFDYILYTSVSALGFAFIENFGYIAENSLRNINARLLYSAVGHMLFSSIIGYSMMLGKYYFSFKGKKIIMFLVGFILAALTHTFYDFWLIDSWASQFPQMTTLLMLVGIHAWFVMKNNALNISNFFTPRLIIKNDSIRFNLLIFLVCIFMGSYTVNSLIRGEEFGFNMLKYDFFNYSFFVLYLVFSFSRYETIRGYVRPLKIPYNLLIPRLGNAQIKNQDEVKLFSVKLNKKVHKKHKFDDLSPVNGIVREEILIAGEPDNYIVDIDKDLKIEKFQSWQVVIQANSKSRQFNKNGKSLVNVLVVLQNVDLKSNELLKSDFRFIGLMVMLADK